MGNTGVSHEGRSVRLDEIDEYMHELGPEPNFNESMYFNAFDPTTESGGFLRLGNRANEGRAEMTICLYLPDGRVGFMFGRPAIDDNSAFDAGGMKFTVERPFESLRVSYEGDVVVLADPRQMADPRRAFRDNPHVAASVHLHYTRAGPMFGGEPTEPVEAPGEEFARGHYEQLNEVRGTIVVGDESWDLAGFGLRDHSWGPRYWQAPWYYRWLTANFGPDLGFMASEVVKRSGSATQGGFVWDGDRLHITRDVRIVTTYDPDELHRSVEVEMTSREGRRWRATGEVLSMIPLRNRRRSPEGEELMTRIGEGMTRWTLDGGRVGYGMSEYLDQIVDGHPVGLD